METEQGPNEAPPAENTEQKDAEMKEEKENNKSEKKVCIIWFFEVLFIS